MANDDRDVLFSNETFVIGMLQAVSGGALVAAISQTGALTSIAGNITFRIFLTCMIFSLIAAVTSAYLKHSYKLWDVKALDSLAKKEDKLAGERSKKANLYLIWMRRSFFVSLILILLGFIVLVCATWRPVVFG